jgi:Glucodextranase, domain B
MNSLVRRATSILLLAAPLLATAAPMAWFADELNVHQADASTRTVLRSVPLNALALAAEPSGGAWVTTASNVVRLDAQGASVLTVSLASLGLAAPVRATADARDGSAWLMSPGTLVHLSPQGQVLHSTALPGDNHAQAVAVALDGRVWALGKTWLIGVSATGVVTSHTKVSNDLGGPATSMGLDPLSPTVWVIREDSGGSARRIARVDASTSQPTVTSIDSTELAGVAADAFAGGAWTLPSGAINRYNAAGTLIQSAALGTSLGAARGIAVDPSTSALWLAREQGVSVLTADAAPVANISTNSSVKLISLSPFRPQPTLALLAPPSVVATNNRQPTITLAYGSDCYGVVCTVAADRLGSFTLSAQLAGAQVGSSFAYDTVTQRATYTPPTPLSDGTYQFAAAMTDRFGQATDTVQSAITVDTVSPSLVELSPPNNSSLVQAAVTLSGRIDEPGFIQFGGTAVQGPTFSFPTTLRPGANALSLSLTDIAGNSATKAITLTYVPPGILLSIDSPLAGAVVTGDSVLVTGRFSGPANTGITVNGQIAAILGDRYYANVLLPSGPNQITTVATAPALEVTRATLNVTRVGASPVLLTPQPASGVAPFATRFTITNNSGKRITGWTLDRESDGVEDARVGPTGTEAIANYANPGLYQARAIVTFDDSTQATATTSIVAADPAPLDAALRAMWQRFTTALGAGDIEAALRLFNDDARLRYAPVLTALAPHMFGILQSFSPLARVSLSTDISEYAVVRRFEGRNLVYLIYFLRDADGVWRIDSM